MTKSQLFRLRNTSIYANAIATLQQMQLAHNTNNPEMEVVIREHNSNRSIQQNSLFHKWMGEISKGASNEYAGNSEIYWKRFYKNTFLIPIFERDDKDGGYTKAVNDLRAIWTNSEPQYQNSISSIIADATHTSNTTIKQMSEFMRLIQDDTPHKGVQLTIPDDMGWMERIGFELSQSKNHIL